MLLKKKISTTKVCPNKKIKKFRDEFALAKELREVMGEDVEDSTFSVTGRRRRTTRKTVKYTYSDQEDSEDEDRDPAEDDDGDDAAGEDFNPAEHSEDDFVPEDEDDI